MFLTNMIIFAILKGGKRGAYENEGVLIGMPVVGIYFGPDCLNNSVFNIQSFLFYFFKANVNFTI